MATLHESVATFFDHLDNHTGLDAFSSAGMERGEVFNYSEHMEKEYQYEPEVDCCYIFHEN